MKKHFNLLVALCTLSFIFNFSFSQDKIFFDNQIINEENYTINISNVVGLTTELKFKLEIENKSDNFLLFDASKCTFIVNGEKLNPKDKFMLIEPYKKKSKTVVTTGLAYNKIKQFEFELDGIQKTTNVKAIEVKDTFYLPASTNEFQAGNFTVQLNNYKKETGGTNVKFNAQYKGNKIGFVNPSKITVLMPDNKTYANAKKHGASAVFPGEIENVNASWNRMPDGKINDMQKATMKIIFNDAFSEGEAIDLPKKTLKFENPSTTKGK